MNIIATELHKMEKRNVGRPPKFTPERRQAILESIADRIPYEIAAEANGICEETLYAWIRDGRADLKEGIDSEHAQFSEAIKKTEQEKIREHLDSIRSKPERWQADAWILERRWWKYFSPSAAIIEFNQRLEKMEEKSQGENHGKEVDSKSIG